MFPSRLALIAFTTVAIATGCTATESDPAPGASDDEINRLSGPEIVGDIAIDGASVEVTLPARDGRKLVRRALRFTAPAGVQLTAFVMIATPSGDVESILDAKWQTLASDAESHDRPVYTDAGAPDAPPRSSYRTITFTPAKAATYYVALEDKQGKAARYVVTLSKTAPADTTPKWYEGWPSSSSTTYDVDLESIDSQKSPDLTCVADPKTAQYSYLGMATLHCEVNIETKTIRCGFPDLFSGGRETEVENDGTFHFATADGHSSDYVSGSGSIKYGGRDIRIDDLYTQGCEVASETNRTLYGRRTHYVAATGAVR